MRFHNHCLVLVFVIGCSAHSSLLFGQEKSGRETISVAGRIVDKDGQGVPDALVGLAHCLDSEIDQQIATTTNVDGTYELDLVLNKPGDAFRTFVMAARGSKLAWNSQYIVRGKRNAVAAPDLVLQPARVLKLKVVDDNGNAISDATVEYVYMAVGSGDERLFDKRLAKILETSLPRSATDGSLELDFLPVDDCYSIGVAHPNFAQELAVVSDQPQSHDVVLSTGRLIRIQVNCNDRSAIAATTIKFRRDNRSHQEDLAISAAGGGTIRLKQQQALSIQLSHPSMAPVPPYLFHHNVDEVGVCEFDLVPIGRVVGKVIDAQFGGAATGVDVTVVEPNSNRVVGKAKTDEKGAYEIACPATKSKITLARDTNWESDDQHTVDVKPEGDTQVPSIAATGLRPLIGRVVTSSNKPSQAIVSHGFRGFPVITKPDGTFVFSGEHFKKRRHLGAFRGLNRPGELLLVFDTVDGETAIVPVDPGNTRPMTVKLNKPTSVVGTVVDLNGQLLAGVAVDLAVKVQRTTVYRQARAYSDQGKSLFESA